MTDGQLRTETSSEQLAEAISAAWDFGDPTGSEARFRALADERGQGGDRAGALEVMTQVARSQGLARRFAEAHATLDALEAEPAVSLPAVQIRYLLERGRVFNSSQEPERARPLFEQAWSLARSEGIDDLAVDAAHMVAITLLSTPERALEWNDIGLELARASTKPRARRWLGPLLNNQGWTRFERAEYETALALFEEALEFRSQQDDTQPANWRATRIAGWCVAKTLRVLGKVQQALQRLESLLVDYQAAGKTNGYVFEELGECQLALGAPERARPFFAQAYAELAKDAYFAKQEAARLERIGTLGGVVVGSAQK